MMRDIRGKPKEDYQILRKIISVGKLNKIISIVVVIGILLASFRRKAVFGADFVHLFILFSFLYVLSYLIVSSANILLQLRRELDELRRLVEQIQKSDTQP